MKTNKIKGSCSKQLANNPNTPAPIFTFKPYDADHSPFYNNPENIDFVTYNGSLYVCVYDGSTYQAGSPSANNFLLLVEKGKDGRQGIDGKPGPVGPKPGYRMRFNGKQLEIFNEDGTREAVSDELVGPAWIPELHDHKIIWRINDDGSVPSDIDLDQLRPIEENPILFRLNSDNTKREDEETGPGYYIQWKREGNEHWTNLMSISELMNIALAGICFWKEPDKNGAKDVNGKVIERLHLGHKQVVKATYDSSKLGNKKIAEVVLGDVLFDAGEIPFPNYDDAIAALNSYICDLEEDLNAIHIPTKLSEFTNDVPYIRTVNGHAPDNDNGRFDLKVKTIDGNDIVGDAGDLALKKVNGYKLIKTLDDPDDIWINSVDAWDKETSDRKYQPKGNYVEKVQLNDNEPVAPVNGIVKLTIGDYNLTEYVKKTDLAKINNQVLYRGGNISINNWDSIGLEDVEIRVYSGKLQYRKKEDGSFGSWSDIMVISAGGNGEHVELKIENGSLYIKYNEGEFEKVGDIGSGTGSGDTVNGYVSARIDGSKLILTHQDGTNDQLTLPSSSSTSGITEAEVNSIIGRVLAGALVSAIPNYSTLRNNHNYFIRLNDLSSYATQEWVTSLIQEISGGSITVTTYRPFSVYTRTATTTAPTKPSVNDWKWFPSIDNKLHDASKTESEIEAGSLDTVNGWTNDVPNATDSLPYLWQSWNTFADKTGVTDSEWQEPALMTGSPGKDGKNGTNGKNGKNGTDGADGDSIKFIYKLINNRVDEPSKPNGTGASTPDGWNDDAQGISVDNPVEWYCYSTKTSNTWSTWNGPFRWSVWGENGVDGAGVQYIYCKSAITTTNDPSKLAKSVIDSDTYQNPTEEYVPQKGATLEGGKTLSQNWSKEPQGVTASEPNEYVCVRKRISNVWSAYTAPKLWAHYGTDSGSIHEVLPTYVIAPMSTTVTKDPNDENRITGEVTFKLLDSGTPEKTSVGSWLTASLISSNTPLTITNDSDIYTATVPNNIQADDSCVQISWYAGNDQKLLNTTTVIPLIVKGTNGQDGQDGQDGSAQGLNGKVMRISSYQDGKTYNNGNVAENGVFYVDVVRFNDEFYKIQDSISPSTVAGPPFNENDNKINEGWELFNKLGDVAISNLLANTAFINSLTSRQIVVTNGKNDIVAGMVSSTVIPNSELDGYEPGNVRIWAGKAKNNNLTTAPFTVTDTGIAKFGESSSSVTIVPNQSIAEIEGFGNINSSAIIVSGENGFVKMSAANGTTQTQTSTAPSLIMSRNDEVVINIGGTNVSHNVNSSYIKSNGKGYFSNQVETPTVNATTVIRKRRIQTVSSDDTTVTVENDTSDDAVIFNNHSGVTISVTSAETGSYFEIITIQQVNLYWEGFNSIRWLKNGSVQAIPSGRTYTLDPGRYTMTCIGNGMWYLV